MPLAIVFDGIVLADKLRKPEGGKAAAPLQHFVVPFQEALNQCLLMIGPAWPWSGACISSSFVVALNIAICALQWG